LEKVLLEVAVLITIPLICAAQAVLAVKMVATVEQRLTMITQVDCMVAVLALTLRAETEQSELSGDLVVLSLALILETYNLLGINNGQSA
jgi:hypothetical protein